MSIGIELDNAPHDGVKITVYGVGGAGGNIVNNLVKKELNGIDCVAANTDKQALDVSLAQTKQQLGKQITGGKGAGGKPEIGKKATEESLEEVKETIRDTDLLFICAGMGGGTGTGGAPTIAKTGMESGALVVAFVTTPYNHEGKVRIKVAEEGINELKQHVDALIVIPNQNLLEFCPSDMPFKEVLKQVDDMLANAVIGMLGIITEVGTINVDFADVCTILKGKGDALIGTGSGSGKNKANEAFHNALNSPLLNGKTIEGAKSILLNMVVGEDFTNGELGEILTEIQNKCNEQLNFIHGIVHKNEMEGKVDITVIATDFSNPTKENNNAKKNSSGKYDLFTINADGTEIMIPKNQENPYRPNIILNPRPNISRQDGVISTPKGHEQLGKYDEPAISRINSTEARPNEFDSIKNIFEKQHSNEYSTQEAGTNKENVKDISIPPVFKKLYD